MIRIFSSSWDKWKILEQQKSKNFTKKKIKIELIFPISVNIIQMNLYFRLNYIFAKKKLASDWNRCEWSFIRRNNPDVKSFVIFIFTDIDCHQFIRKFQVQLHVRFSTILMLLFNTNVRVAVLVPCYFKLSSWHGISY